ncbi:MAG: mannose-1-phosphate guanylyltransferase/mannose-6-phosphate isomerase [Blastochloris viridis]|uniref:mannose-1-phosphate guanylyltransferase n=1 Tax=Blastochloris viridis TaxID=1079 RepID=A0A6N4RDG3_BLAVI|nr:MAG: mannose-1-phosphate guanylyltransferase/mannose-6-phosphate isomerase [Blastochloris viridis]
MTIDTRIQPVILCGGSGSRLWPLSRSAMPKPFISLGGQMGHTLFQHTALRVQGAGMLPPVVVCAEAHRFYVLNQLEEIGITPAAIILEPQARNTTAAIALATEWAKTNSVNVPLAILPADHLMGSPAEFQESLKAATAHASDSIVLFGINPSFANTEYGYIQLGENIGGGAHKVIKFLEKPNRASAEMLLVSGNHVWNSGMFISAPELLAREIFEYAQDVASKVSVAWDKRRSETLLHTEVIRPDETFGEVPSIQFDNAVMEKTQHAVVLAYSGRWSDIGGFAALAEALPQDDSGNSISAPEDSHVLVPDTIGSLIHSSVPNKIVAVHGLSDAVVIDTADALLVTTKSRSAGVKSIFQSLQAARAPQAEFHNRVHRPWGWYETIVKGPGYLVKRIGVIPGGRLSLQYHHHRAEHWTVVTGTATVTKGEEILTLNPDESVYLPLGIHHRLENKSSSDMVEIIEVQTGKILVEEDIVRVEDIYHRT